MTYRDAQVPCAFCDERSARPCPRCASPVCASHAKPGRWCVICQQELEQMELEAAFEADVRARNPLHMRGDDPDQQPGLFHFVAYGLARVWARLNKSAARKKFEAKSHAEIAAWRKTLANPPGRG